jgi:N12 class adenine-specific DNA methylase
VPADQDELAPSGAKARFTANLEAIRVSRALKDENRYATVDEQKVLARWSSWGALPDVFDESKQSWHAERSHLQQILSAEEYAEARRTTINAHYTDPAYVREVWAALQRLGFDGGDVLEPGVGAGSFIGLAPETAAMTGVELDSVTASITAGLYPHAEIHTESFADSRFRRGHFDAAVGNVPFANVALHDPSHNAGGHSIHNHFIIKSLALTRPGGLVAVLTSHYTLDSQNPAARREMNSMAELVGAVRLPTGAHRRSAGTEALTDLLIFRRREPGVPPSSLLWETVVPKVVDGQKITINSYFDYRPQHVLGELHVGTGMYGAATVSVTADLEQTPAKLNLALDEITTEAIEAGLVMTPRSAHSSQERAAFIPADASQWDGTIVPQAGDKFTIVANGGHQALAVPKAHARELRALVELRDAATSVLTAEAASLDDTPAVSAARARLRDRYASYQATYGPLNRFTLRPTGHTDPETDEPRYARITPKALMMLRQDPFGPLVMALERFDEETQRSTPAAILTQRVVQQRATTYGAESPAEAIALSLDRTGKVDLPTIAQLLGQTTEEARDALGELVYDEPGTERLLHSAEYLSGDVRKKLDVARDAAAADERYQVNVDALSRVIPPALSIDQIEARLGAVWIDAATHRQFLEDILRDQSVKVENPVPGMWEVRGQRGTIRATSEWGTQRRPATDLAQALMEQKPVTVYDEYEDSDGRTRRILNPTETTAAQEKADQLQERFGEWVWEDNDRANRLADEYNRRFNSIVLRDYKGAGDYLTLPGMAANFVPLPHQRDAIARGIAEPAVGLFHEVGAGKTAEMVIIAMELKRMGLISKPAVVVPNHMLEQFGREWLQIYPQARILAASSEDLAGDKRRLFVARAAANDWDAVILTRTAFERMPLSPDTERTYIAEQVSALRTALDEAKGESALSVKRIERAVLAMEQKQKALADKPRDAGITFEKTGIDYLVVDELHDYKNLATPSNIPDAQIAGSQRASDLHMKLEYLRAQHGERVVTGATATPLANSITEAYVMQRFLRPDLLTNAGIGSFDAWAATFGETVTDMEMAPTGNGNFRLKTRFAKFQNVPEMLRMWHVFADVKTAEDLKLPVPLVRARGDGQRLAETIVVTPTREIEEYIQTIGDRAEAVANKSIPPDVDNMLKISTDGRKASVDIRLVRNMEPSGFTMLDAAAAAIHQEWQRTRDLEYLDVISGEPSEIRGGLQLVFLDLSTPNPDRWNAYDELRLLLVEKGMPADSIRFIHEAKNDSQKARLFAAARAGHISVLLGSTSKMGVGTNVQARITALHDLDSPWRPGDLRQRHGRGIRQGNQNPEIGMYRYVVERSFAAYMWQTVERKAKFIAQIMRGNLDVRELEDIGDDAMSAAEAKALSSGNPLLLEKATADNELSRLQRLERAHQRNLLNLSRTRESAARRIETAGSELRLLETALPRVRDTSGELFKMTIGGVEYSERTEAGHALARWANAAGLRYLGDRVTRGLGAVGTIGDFSIEARTEPNIIGQPLVVLHLVDVPRATIMLPRDAFLEGGVGLVRQLENRAAGIPKLIEEITAERAQNEATIAEADERLQVPFKHAAELVQAEVRSESIRVRMAEMIAQQGKDAAAGSGSPSPSAAAVSADFPAPPTAALTASPAATPVAQRPGVREPGQGLGR